MFRAIWKDGRSYADEWFPVYDPLKHDAVCGPSEEFGEIGFEEAAPGECFLKIGIGRLRRPDTAPYDRFRLHEIVDEGQRTLEGRPECIVFRQMLDADDYVKTVRILSPERFKIVHTLRNTSRETIRCTILLHPNPAAVMVETEAPVRTVLFCPWCRRPIFLEATPQEFSRPLMDQATTPVRS